MSTLRRALVVLAVTLAVAGVGAQQVTGPFRFERPITASASGPQRLAIDVPLLAGGAPFAIDGTRARPLAIGGLDDLRLFDAAGAELPYLLVYAPPSEPVWQRGDILPLLSTEKTSGFEVDFGEPFTMDAVHVGGLRAPFLKRLVLEGSGDRQRWTLLAAEGTLFNLPDEQMQQTQLPFTAGAYRYLRVTWDDTNSGRVNLPRVVEGRRVTAAAPPPALRAALAIERRASEPGRSRYRVRLPAARLPVVALEVQADGGHVYRQATVYQSRLANNRVEPSQVGSALLRRIVRDGVSAGSLRVPVSGVVESELDLVVEDGANQPLAITGVTAILAELPWIYFEAPAGALVARYGHATLRGPAYDLEAVRDRVTPGDVPDARWGEPRPSSTAGPAGPPAPMPQTGAPLEAGGFRHVRPLPGGDAQLVALPLDAAVLAHSRGVVNDYAASVRHDAMFADVRVLDADNRQVPYLIERRDEPLSIDLALKPAARDDTALQEATGRSWSSYTIELPYEHLPARALVLETSARVFQRNVRVLIEQSPDRHRRNRSFRVLSSEQWAHASEQDAPSALALAVHGPLPKRLVLSVDEGDNQPLPLTGARLLLPLYRIRFYRPAGAQLRLAYGRDDLSPPRYDLALLAPHVLGVEAHEIAASAEADTAGPARAALFSPRMFWVLLAGAVVLLLALIGRLVLRA